MSLTLIIPFLNEKKNLIKFFKDIKKYKLQRKFEIIFVDDGSSDGSFELVNKNKKLIKKCKVIKNKQNYGSHISMLIGLKFVKTNFFIFYFIDQEIDLYQIISLYKISRTKKKSLILTRYFDKEMNFYSRLFWNMFSFIYKIKYKNICSLLINKNHFFKNKSIKIKNSSFIYLDLLKNINLSKTTEKKIATKNRKIGRSNWTLFKKIKLLLNLFFFRSSNVKIFMYLISILLVFETLYFLLVLIVLECYFQISERKKINFK